MNRIIAWFSCGAASAVAASLAIARYGDKVKVVYCDTSKDEHPDNPRFMADVSRWLKVPIQVIRSNKYETVDEVNEETRYMSGIDGARCTMELKRIPRLAFQKPDDIHVFGFTAEEGDRIQEFEDNNPFMRCKWPLLYDGYTKQDCYKALEQAGIEIPTMYRLGFHNNNCIGCVKATSPGYWNKVRGHFPDMFQIRAARSRELGVRLVRVKGERIFLDELPEDATGRWKDEVIAENVTCGPQCKG